MAGFTGEDLGGTTVQGVMGAFMGFAIAPEFMIAEVIDPASRRDRGRASGHGVMVPDARPMRNVEPSVGAVMPVCAPANRRRVDEKMKRIS